MLRKLVFGSIAAALSLGALAVPVGAAGHTAQVAIVQGLPFKVDLCLGKEEVVSRFRYGRADFLEMEAGTYKWTVRRADPGTCTGRRIGTTSSTYAAGEDYTSVLWKPYRKVRVKTYLNAILVPSGKSTLVFRHTAKVPKAVDVWAWEHMSTAEEDLFPPTWSDVPKGGSSTQIEIRPGQFYLDVYNADPADTSFDWEGYWSRTDAEQVREAYLVGTNKKNTRVVSIYGPGEVPEPTS